MTIYKYFIGLYLDYGYVIFDQACNKSFQESLESLQYNASLTLTGAIKGTWRENLYQELGLKSFQHRRLHVTFMCYYLCKPPLIIQDQIEK